MLHDEVTKITKEYQVDFFLVFLVFLGALRDLVVRLRF